MTPKEPKTVVGLYGKKSDENKKPCAVWLEDGELRFKVLNIKGGEDRKVEEMEG